jgi:hypothetical protein
MPTRIIFNGQEYAGAEAMPEDVRKAYQEALGALADKDGDGLPDGLQSGADNVVNIHHSSFTLKGLGGSSQGALPPALGWLAGLANRGSGPDPVAAPESPGRDRLLGALDSATRTVGLGLQIVALFVAGGVIVGGGWIIANMDEGSRSQGGVFYIGLGMAVALGCAVAIIISAQRGRSR